MAMSENEILEGLADIINEETGLDLSLIHI